MIDGGVIVWVVGDQIINGSESGTSFRQALYFKQLGFNIHDTMIYEKCGCAMPDPTRYGQTFEYVFIISKGKPKTINLLKDRQNRWAGTKSFGTVSKRKMDGSLIKQGQVTVQEKGVRFNIWRYHNGFGYGTKDLCASKHPATMPEELAKDHILSWSKEGDLVLDPFAGSATTLKMAKQTKRNYLGFEISEEYVGICKERLKQNIIGDV